MNKAIRECSVYASEGGLWALAGQPVFATDPNPFTKYGSTPLGIRNPAYVISAEAHWCQLRLFS